MTRRIPQSQLVDRSRDELGLLLDELRSFAANRSAGVHRKCMSNLYYASLHAVRALLFSHGLEAKTQEGTQRLFAAHFVKAERFPNSDLKTLASLESDRLRADYQGYYEFDASDVDSARGPVMALVRRSLDHLAEREGSAISAFEGVIRKLAEGL